MVRKEDNPRVLLVTNVGLARNLPLPTSMVALRASVFKLHF